MSGGGGITYVEQNVWTFGIRHAEFMSISPSSFGRIHKKPDQHFLEVLTKLKNGNRCCMYLESTSLSTDIFYQREQRR